jgi:hypothetical protein
MLRLGVFHVELSKAICTCNDEELAALVEKLPDAEKIAQAIAAMVPATKPGESRIVVRVESGDEVVTA